MVSRRDEALVMEKEGYMTIQASFYSNGTCQYKVHLDGKLVDKNMVGIVKDWNDLLRILANHTFAKDI